ncbi:MAG: alpha/beta fold hydrolase [Chloroflexota bacterium]
MRRVIFSLLVFGSMFIVSLGAVHAQGAGAQLTILDKNGDAITSLTDGDRVSLGIQLDSPLDSEAQVDFLLAGVDSPVAGCRLEAGVSACRSEAFWTLGWFWSADGTRRPQRGLTAQIDGQPVNGSLSLTIAPRPVVMVHGFNANFHTWDAYLGPQGYLATLGLRGYAVGDGQVEGVMNTGSLSDPAARTNSIAGNAAILGEYIANVQEATGAQKVDLLVHSMGGMISRYYLDRLMTEDNVAQLIILGTPMAGSACASLPASLGLLLPATLEIQPAYMVGVFNRQIVRRQGVPFHALAGTKLQDTVASPCTPVPSDLVVTIDSVKAIPMPVQEISLLHTELNTAPEVFEQFVTPLLETPPGEFETAADPPAGSVAPLELQFTKIYTGHLDPGETGTVTISIDPNVTVANFSLYDTSRSLEVRVTGASGNEIALDPEKNGLIRVDDPSTLVYLGYGFKQPKPGKWVVTLLTTPETPPAGADYALSANFNGGATLAATTSLTVPRVNETVTISANLTADGAPVALGSAQAILRHPDGSADTLEMAVNGNSATLEVIPRSSGIYGLEVDVTALAPDGTAIDRAAFLSFEAQPLSAEFLIVRGLAGAGALIVLAGVYLVLRARKRRVG